MSLTLEEIIDKLSAQNTDLNNQITALNSEISKMQPVELYTLPSTHPSAGSTITLLESIADFKYLEFYLYGNDIMLVCNKIFNNYQTNNQIQLSWVTNGVGIVYPKGSLWSISGVTLTHNYSYCMGLYGGNQGYYDSDAPLFMKILGYK